MSILKVPFLIAIVIFAFGYLLLQQVFIFDQKILNVLEQDLLLMQEEVSVYKDDSWLSKLADAEV